MSELQPLSGLKGAEPIGFLAAVGLLRVLSARRSFGAVKLSWSDDSAWTAVLHTEKPCDETMLIEKFVSHMVNRSSAPEFNGRGICPDSLENQTGCWLSPSVLDDVKISLELYRQLLDVTRSGSRSDQREAADFLSAFGSELIAARSSGDLKPSAFHMTSARQQFLEACRKLADSLGSGTTARGTKEASAAFKEAIFGPWEYTDEFSALGFDPNTEAVYALVALAPGGEKPVSTRAAVWLAIETLPLFPAHPTKGRLHTRGFDLRATAFRWPIWDGALAVDGIRTALGVPRLFDKDAPSESPNRPVRAVFESERVTIGQGYGQFRPAVRVG